MSRETRHTPTRDTMSVATVQVKARNGRDRLGTTITIAIAREVAAAWDEGADGNAEKCGWWRGRTTGGRSRAITSFARMLRTDAPEPESATNDASQFFLLKSSATTTRMARGMTTALLPSHVTMRIASVKVGVRWSTNHRVTLESKPVEPSAAQPDSSSKPRTTVRANATANAMATRNAARRGSCAGLVAAAIARMWPVIQSTTYGQNTITPMTAASAAASSTAPAARSLMVRISSSYSRWT